jgi:O-antigen ligase
LLATPLGGLFEDRLATPHSNRGRFEIYRQVVEQVEKAPVFGYGGPQEAVGKYLPQLGTQGTFWLVLFSHGVPGAILFTGFFVLMLWRSRRARTSLAFSSHVVILIGLVQMPYYGLLPAGIHIMMCASALALRPDDDDASAERADREGSGERWDQPAAIGARGP